MPNRPSTVGGGGPAGGGLTDAELRATPVPVSGTVVTGGLTDAELRAVAVPVSGTFFQATQPVSGPLTDTQLRATPVPVSGTVTASGPLTDTQLRATPVPVSGTVTATGPLTDTQLRATAVPVSGTVGTKTALTASAPAAATVGVASAQAVASNGSRKGLALVNVSNNRISFGVGATAVLDSGITLYPGGVWEMDEYTFATGAVNAIASAASSPLAIQEFV